MKNKLLFSTVVIVVVALLASCAAHRESKVGHKSDFFAMNTYVSVFTDKNDASLHKSIRELTVTLEKMLSSKYDSALLKDFSDSSDVYSEYMDLFLLAHDIACKTEGAFDYTLGNLTSLWDITGQARVPTTEQINYALSLCGYKNAQIIEDTLVIENKDIQIDLGAIAKGYTGDRIIELMKSSGINSGYVSLGGNISVTGDSENNIKNGKSGWSVAVNNPFDTSEIIGTVDVCNSTVSVSGSYERYFEKDGKIYHHIFDTKTGYPAQSDIISVAVICENGALADALSTALFVMGYENAVKFYNDGIYDFEAVFTLSSGKVYATDGILDKFIPSYQAKKDGLPLDFPQY